ncbi:MAG: DUF6664 family protein [Blautia massiliensis (ex Durand et al. 2017)]
MQQEAIYFRGCYSVGYLKKAGIL